MLSKLVSTRSAPLARRCFSSSAASHEWSSHFSDLRGHGFLPKHKPLIRLPTEFNPLEEILQKMVYWQPDGTATGLLAKNELRSTVMNDFPDMMNEINKVDVNDDRMNAALFRDFSFLSAAYLLEPCHTKYLKEGDYGQGMDHLPKHLAVPMKALADRIRYGQPLLEYSYGYALNNWKLLNDPEPDNLEYDNQAILPVSRDTSIQDHIELIRKLNGCRDENGFVTVHVAIITQSNRQIQAYDVMFEGARAGNRQMANKGMRAHLQCFQDMYDIMSTMWHESNPKNYLNYRTFIMGVKGNDDIFPGGVLYKGVSDERMAFRGESGAQDSCIPCVDSAFGMDYPRNSLTEYLFDLRAYRPGPHQNHVDWLRQQHIETDFKKFCMQDSYSTFLMLCNIHASFRFRHQHWVMVRKYIMDNSKYPRATGGTPITTWLPNQIGACLENCQVLIANVDPSKLSGADRAEFQRIKDQVESEIDKLFKEVSGLQEDFSGQDFEDFN